MSARDDYPKLAYKADRRATWFSGLECANALNEIDNLRRWKAEVLPLLALLDRCHDLLPPGVRAPLGYSKAEAVEKYLYMGARVNPQSDATSERAVRGGAS